MELIKNCRIHSVVYLYLHWFEFYMFSKMISNEKWHMCYENQLWFETKCSAICGAAAQEESVFIEIKHEIILTAIKKLFFIFSDIMIDKLSKSFMMAAYFGPNLSKLCVVSSTTLCTFDMIKKVMMMNSIKNKAFTPAPVMKFCHGIRVVFR